MTVATPELKAPFPYFGGKSRVAAEVAKESRMTDIPEYVITPEAQEKLATLMAGIEKSILSTAALHTKGRTKGGVRLVTESDITGAAIMIHAVIACSD